MSIEIHFDCLFYRGDRPCEPHKREGVHCPGCPHYQPVVTRILMIKLDAMGDVLRTTCLLPGLAPRFGPHHLTWITGPASVPLLKGNPFIHRVVAHGEEALALLATESFDAVINLDSSPRSAALLTMARARTRIGFGLAERGHVYPVSPEATHWLIMGLFDDVKKANDRTYQDLMCEIVGVDPSSCRYVLSLTPAEREWARNWARGAGLKLNLDSCEQPIIGINTGAGGRWQYKRWRTEGYRELAHRLVERHGAQIVLLGGESEEEYNRLLATECPPGTVVSGAHPIRRFGAIVSLCHLVVTGDTLALHLALALGRLVVVVFGPTSAKEIELYGLGEKVTPAMDCLVCYKETCDFQPACMDLIQTSDVLEAIDRVLEKHCHGS
ncbi:MAG: glycosyltransferase family 9 protein [Candidatus Riflebacteria bacterium]|nr:glycosyltransferase family 9 protein [Candidatus Riflebacteria bacterium]